MKDAGYKLRQVGDSWIVDGPSMKAIYVASTMPSYPWTPKERAEMYLNNCLIQSARANRDEKVRAMEANAKIDDNRTGNKPHSK